MWVPLGVREGQSLCTSTTHNRGRAAGTHHCSCQLGHAGYAVESLVRARLSHRCLPSNKRGGTLSDCDTTWNCMSLCNCSHQFCKNIPVSSDFITTWNQGVFLCSPCISHKKYKHRWISCDCICLLKNGNLVEISGLRSLGLNCGLGYRIIAWRMGTNIRRNTLPPTLKMLSHVPHYTIINCNTIFIDRLQTCPVFR